MATRKRPKKSQPPAEYRSGYERQIRAFLLTNRIPYEYESRKFRLTLPVRNHRCVDCRSSKVARDVSYTPDFVLTATDVVIESKGKFTARDRKIALAMLEQYPLEKYRLMFQRDNWLSSKKHQRYSEWCKMAGIEYAVGTTIPKEWWT